MKTHSSSLSVSVFLAALSLSGAFFPLAPSASAGFRADCAAAKPSDDERKQIRDARLEAEQESIPLEADLKAARLSEKTLLSTAGASFDDAQSASARTADAFAKLSAVKTKLRNTILYTILAPEKREAAEKCRELSSRRRGRLGRRDAHRGIRGDSGPTPPSTVTNPDPTQNPAPDPTDSDPGATSATEE